MNREGIFRAGAKLPPGIREPAKRVFYRTVWPDGEKGIVYLSSIPKSGRHFCNVFMANYVMLLHGKITEPLHHDDAINKIMFNNRDAYIEGHHEPKFVPNPLFEGLGIRDFVFGHSTRFVEYSRAKIIFLYRNPLDFVLSWYTQEFELRKDQKVKYDHPREAIDECLDFYIPHYEKMMGLRRTGRILPVTYERLRQAPEATFGTMIDWCGLKLSIPALRQAIAFSDFRVVRAQEEAGVRILGKNERYKGFFTRAGRIGDWREVLSEADVARIAARLGARGISLDAFTLDLQ